MKLIALLIFFAPLTLPAQTVTDYKNAMKKFQQFYNAGRGDSIAAMFEKSPYDTKTMWTNEWAVDALKQYGTLQSLKYIGIDSLDPNKVYVFETHFSKAGVKTTSLTMNKNFELGTFRFITTSEGITALLKRDKKLH